MNDVDDQGETGQIRGLFRSIVLPVGFASVAIGAGTTGYLLHLASLAPYDDASTLQILSEGFFRSLGFLVLAMGTIKSADPLALTLLTLGRTAGLLFFFYAALAGIGVVFADQLRPLRVEAWGRLSLLPGFDERGNVIVCGVGEDGYKLASEALDKDRNVVAVDTLSTDQTAELSRQGAVVFEGDATHKHLLYNRIRLHHATDVFVTAGNDVTNGAIVEAIDRLTTDGDRSEVLDVTARIHDRRLRRTLHEETDGNDSVHLRTYDVPEATAREILATIPIDDLNDLEERVHVWLVGWTPLSKALVEQLLHLMHYPEGVDRQVTILTERPKATERDIAALSPGLDPEWWDDPLMSEFVRSLFPDIDIKRLPVSDMELLSDRSPIYETLRPQDNLTIIADDDTDERSLRALLSTWAPKLDALTRDLNLDAHLAYRSPADANWTPLTDTVTMTAYTAFGDGCSINKVRGDTRDYVARQLALVYHFLYEEEPTAVLPTRESVPIRSGADIDEVMEWFASVPACERDRYAAAVWHDLTEYKRESNRYAADHLAVKRRMATVLADEEVDTDDDEVIRKLAEAEHRRWCAEKLLDGWEPLSSSDEQRWETDSGEQELRDQRYHPDIRPVDVLRAEMDGEWEKDSSQVEAVLEHPDLFSRATDDLT